MACEIEVQAPEVGVPAVEVPFSILTILTSTALAGELCFDEERKDAFLRVNKHWTTTMFDTIFGLVKRVRNFVTVTKKVVPFTFKEHEVLHINRFMSLDTLKTLEALVEKWHRP